MPVPQCSSGRSERVNCGLLSESVDSEPESKEELYYLKMTVKIHQYSSNYKKRKLESHNNDKIKKVKHDYSVNYNIL